MHKKILEESNIEQLKEFIVDFIDILKSKDEELYNDAEELLYCIVYGEHFNNWSLEKALSKMNNEDGTIGGHWKLEETTDVARSYNIQFNNFDEYDWCYVMNMIYSDYYGAIPNDLVAYVKLAEKFLNDKDSCDGKAYRYYKNI